MSDPSYALQAAVTPALKSAASVQEIVADRVFDKVPTSATFPYVTHGDSQVLPDKTDCIDGAEVSYQIDAWSQFNGFGEVKKLAAAIVAALDDQPLAVTGQNVIVFEHRETRYLRDPDGLTRHAAITFRSLINPI